MPSKLDHDHSLEGGSLSRQLSSSYWTPTRWSAPPHKELLLVRNLWCQPHFKWTILKYYLSFIWSWHSGLNNRIFTCPFQVTTTTKTIREIQYLGPDGQPIEFVPSSSSGGPPPVHPRLSTSSNAGGAPPPQVYDPYSVNGPNGYGDPRFQQPEFGDYEQYGPQYGNYAEYPHRPPTPPSPSDRSASPPPDHREPGKTRKLKVRTRCSFPLFALKTLAIKASSLPLVLTP